MNEELSRLEGQAPAAPTSIPAELKHQLDSLESVASWLASMVNSHGGGPEEPPEPATQFDADLMQAADTIHSAAAHIEANIAAFVAAPPSGVQADWKTKRDAEGVKTLRNHMSILVDMWDDRQRPKGERHYQDGALDIQMGYARTWLKSIEGQWVQEFVDAALAAPPVAPAPAREGAQTPAAQWREKGEPDPHGKRYDCERAALCMGSLSDDELANAAFMHYDRFPAVEDLIAGKAHPPIAYMMAVKDRIRWLSRKLSAAAPAEPPAVEADAKLWAVSVQGPDDLYALPTRLKALEAANEMNAMFAKLDHHENDPIMRAFVIEWPYTAESHAEDIASRTLRAQSAAVEAAPMVKE